MTGGVTTMRTRSSTRGRDLRLLKRERDTDDGDTNVTTNKRPPYDSTHDVHLTDKSPKKELEGSFDNATVRNERGQQSRPRRNVGKTQSSGRSRDTKTGKKKRTRRASGKTQLGDAPPVTVPVPKPMPRRIKQCMERGLLPKELAESLEVGVVGAPSGLAHRYRRRKCASSRAVSWGATRIGLN